LNGNAGSLATVAAERESELDRRGNLERSPMDIPTDIFTEPENVAAETLASLVLGGDPQHEIGKHRAGPFSEWGILC
jgi:hypothetical protein